MRDYNQTRATLALARLGNALGVRLDPDKPDHELLEQLADRAQTLTTFTPTAGRFGDGAFEYMGEEMPSGPFLSDAGVVEWLCAAWGKSRPCSKGHAQSCPCPACTRQGDA